MIRITILSTALAIEIHLFCQFQVNLLLANRDLIKVLLEYSNYAKIFLFNYAIELPKSTNMNEYIIKLVESK